MAFDEARGVTVLFGGGNGFGNDTWTYDGSDWTQEAPSSVPPSRFGSAMAYDKVRQVIVMFGGFVPSGQDANDIWEWDGSNWSPRPPGATQPSRRGAHRLAFDESINQVVLVGGFSTTASGTLSDTWSWDGAAWTQYASMTTTRCDHALGYDQARQRMVLYGGTNFLGSAQTQLGDTWEWSGGTWTQRLPASTPGTRAVATAAYLPPISGFLIAGGETFPGIPSNNTSSYRAVTLGKAESSGVPCVTTSGVELEVATMPYLGMPFTQNIVNAEPTAIVSLLIFGSSWQFFNGVPLPLDLAAVGAPGCNLYASPDVVNTIFLVNGAGSLTWNIPNLPSAAGATFATQGVVLDPTSPLPLQLDMTAGRRCTIGNP